MFSSNPHISILHDDLSNINNMDKNTPIVFVQKSCFFFIFQLPDILCSFSNAYKKYKGLRNFPF